LIEIEGRMMVTWDEGEDEELFIKGYKVLGKTNKFWRAIVQHSDYS
jgi:hypothetical protein